MSRDNEVDAGECLEIDTEQKMPIFYKFNVYQQDIKWDLLQAAFYDYQYLEIDFAKTPEGVPQQIISTTDNGLVPVEEKSDIEKLVSLIQELDKTQISIELLEIKNCTTPEEIRQFEQLITCLKGTKLTEIMHDKCKFHTIEAILVEVWAYNNGIKLNTEEMPSIGETVEEYYSHTFSSSY